MSLKVINTEESIKNNVKRKAITFKAPKGRVMTQNQIKDFCQDFERKLPKGTTMVVKGLNILKDTCLYTSFKDKWLNEDEYDEYLKRFNVEDVDKFDTFFTFTIIIRKDLDGNDNFDDEDEF